MKTERVIAALCYFSVLFAPFLFPIVVYFVAQDEVKDHARRALLSHFLPFLSLVFIVFMFTHVHYFVLWMGVVIFLFVTLMFIVTIWNLVMGIKLLLEKD